MDLLLLILPLLTLAMIGWVVTIWPPISPPQIQTVRLTVIVLLAVSLMLWGLRMLTQ